MNCLIRSKSDSEQNEINNGNYVMFICSAVSVE